MLANAYYTIMYACNICGILWKNVKTCLTVERICFSGMSKFEFGGHSLLYYYSKILVIFAKVSKYYISLASTMVNSRRSYRRLRLFMFYYVY